MAFTEPLTVELSHAICRFNPIDMGSVVELPENTKNEDFRKLIPLKTQFQLSRCSRKPILFRYVDHESKDIGVCDKWFCNCMINIIQLKLQRKFCLILNYNVFTIYLITYQHKHRKREKTSPEISRF